MKMMITITAPITSFFNKPPDMLGIFGGTVGGVGLVGTVAAGLAAGGVGPVLVATVEEAAGGGVAGFATGAAGLLKIALSSIVNNYTCIV
jgi:hypothetical protein